MMRAKESKVVVTFASTSDAMSMEVAARANGIPGRIIPVPSEISAGCGLSWCAPTEQREELLEGIRRFELAHEGVFTVEMY